eukprot:Skav214490  [mRNA]  locus=scaffold1011:88423:89535:- [translate_table: standard]
MTSSKLPHLAPPIKPDGPGRGGGYASPGSRGSPGSRRSSVFDESSDEEDQVSLTFPEELLAKPLPFASKFGSPYHTPETDSRAAEAFQGKGSKVESANGSTSSTGLFGFAAKLFDMFGFQASAEPVKLGTASEGLPKPFRPSETAIIFDWDDTLFPTSHVVQTVEGTLPADDAFHAKLDKVSETVRDLLTRAKSCGQVAIVTLSRRPWVTNSANEFLPKLEIEALLKELRIPVIYSRECLKPYMMRSPDGDFEEGVCPLTMAKELAMKKVLKKLYGKNPWTNVLSIGDSVTERTAITELLWAHMGEDARSCCKTLKMLQDPSIDQLQMELDIIKVGAGVLWGPFLTASRHIASHSHTIIEFANEKTHCRH